MTATIQIGMKARFIIEGLALEAVETVKVLNERIAELSCEELRILLIAYECSIGDLAAKLWACEVTKKK